MRLVLPYQQRLRAVYPKLSDKWNELWLEETSVDDTTEMGGE